MYYQKKKSGNYLTGIIIGSAAASILTMLFSSKSGKEVRQEISEKANKAFNSSKEVRDRIVENAKNVSIDIQTKGNELLKLAKDYSSGSYSGSKEGLMKEFDKIKNAINTAISVYNADQAEVKDTEEIVEDIFSEYDDDTTPKNEGMGRRS